MADASRIGEGMGADIVDVNMGCPVPKIAKHTAGCSLMREPEHAAAVIQGYEDMLLIHKKGPTEILLPTVFYSLSNHLNETTSRLPFALAGFTALFAIWLLGWRLFGPLVGFVAAFLLMFDGYYIGFARIVQYQSVVILMTACVALILQRLSVRPFALTRYLTLAALLLATGLLSHYEAALAILPAAYFLGVLLYRYPDRRPKIVVATLIAGAIGVGLLALFYVPFVLHPQFSATYTYLTDRRIGLDVAALETGITFPYNNLADFFLRSTVYNTTYYEVLRMGILFGALLLIYANLWGRRVATILALVRDRWPGGLAGHVGGKTATLNHELRDDPVENRPLVVAGANVLEEILDRLGRLLGVQFDDDGALAGLQNDLWFGGRLGRGGRRATWLRRRQGGGENESKRHGEPPKGWDSRLREP